MQPFLYLFGLFGQLLKSLFQWQFVLKSRFSNLNLIQQIQYLRNCGLFKWLIGRHEISFHLVTRAVRSGPLRQPLASTGLSVPTDFSLLYIILFCRFGINANIQRILDRRWILLSKIMEIAL